jgi:hypothetical protein
VDGDEGVGMATPSNTTSTATPMVTPTSTLTPMTTSMVTATPMAPQGPMPPLELSGVYYPTVPLRLHHLIDITNHLNQFENDSLLRNSVLPMKTKFAKYWNRIPMLYSFAFVLDPRAKMRGFHKELTLISNLTSTDYANYYESVRAQLTAVLTNYDLRFDGQNPHQKQAPLAGAGKKRKA